MAMVCIIGKIYNRPYILQKTNWQSPLNPFYTLIKEHCFITRNSIVFLSILYVQNIVTKHTYITGGPCTCHILYLAETYAQSKYKQYIIRIHENNLTSIYFLHQANCTEYWWCHQFDHWGYGTAGIVAGIDYIWIVATKETMGWLWTLPLLQTKVI